MNIDIEQAMTVLRREEFLLERASHSLHFQSLTGHLLTLFSTTAVIPTLSATEIQLYSTLALLHDIGKQTIPPAILNKSGALTAEEFNVVKAHTTQGCRLLEQHPDLSQCAVLPLMCDVCRHHHERWDGGGYPDGLTGIYIAPGVQVVGLADAFDALVHPRVYKPAYTVDQARRMIVSGACGAFEPQMLAEFNWNIEAVARAVYGRHLVNSI